MKNTVLASPSERKALDAAIAALSAPQHPAEAQAQGGGERRDREADRARFHDAAFNEWLDTGISDAGHTVWDAVGDVADAWAGWEARQFAGDAVLFAECCGREECGGECGNEWRGMGMYRKPSDDPTAPPSAPVEVEGLRASLSKLAGDWEAMGDDLMTVCAGHVRELLAKPGGSQ